MVARMIGHLSYFEFLIMSASVAAGVLAGYYLPSWMQK
jgi:hypothetical protein